MKVTKLSSTDLKRKTAEVLNLVAFGEVTAIVERYGEPLVKISPIKKTSTGVKNLEKTIEGSFGMIADFPEVTSNRYFRKKRVSL